MTRAKPALDEGRVADGPRSSNRQGKGIDLACVFVPRAGGAMFAAAAPPAAAEFRVRPAAVEEGEIALENNGSCALPDRRSGRVSRATRPSSNGRRSPGDSSSSRGQAAAIPVPSSATASPRSPARTSFSWSSPASTGPISASSPNAAGRSRIGRRTPSLSVPRSAKCGVALNVFIVKDVAGDAEGRRSSISPGRRRSASIGLISSPASRFTARRAL